MLDQLFEQIDDGVLQVTGEGGSLPEMIKAVLERGLQAELSEHLGYDKGDPARRGSPTARNGSMPTTLSREVGQVPLDTLDADSACDKSTRSREPDSGLTSNNEGELAVDHQRDLKLAASRSRGSRTLEDGSGGSTQGHRCW